jgi:hypothetical protein
MDSKDQTPMGIPLNLPTWAELFRLTTKATIGLLAVAAFFLFFPAERFPKWASVADFQKSNQASIVAVFIFCGTALIFEILLFSVPFFKARIYHWKYRRNMERFLDSLTVDEKAIVGSFFKQRERVVTFWTTQVAIQPLLDREIMRLSARGQVSHSFELHPIARKYIEKNPRLCLTQAEIDFSRQMVEDFMQKSGDDLPPSGKP